MPRKPTGDRPLTDAEKMRRYRAARVTFKPANAVALAAAAAAAGISTADLVAQVVDGWLTGSQAAPPPLSAAEIDAARLVDSRRRAILERLADVLSQASTPDTLERIERRLAVIEDVVGLGASRRQIPTS